MRGGSCADDGNLCTDDLCKAGHCTHPPAVDFTSCGTGTADARFKQCISGVCKPPKAFCTGSGMSFSFGVDETGKGMYTDSSGLNCECLGAGLALFSMTLTTITCAASCRHFVPNVLISQKYWTCF